MKILFIAAANSTHTVRWVNSLSERGHDVMLVFIKGHEPQEDVLNESVVPYCLQYGGAKGYYLNALELRSVKNSFKPDVINVHYASGYGTLARIARIGPFILSVWGSDVYSFPNEGFLKYKILKKNIMYAKKITSTSICMANELKKVLKQPDFPIEVIPFGVNIQKFDPNQYEKKDKKSIVIGNIKSLKPLYGIKELIDVFQLLVTDKTIDENIRESMQLVIYGGGEQKQELENRVKELKLEKHVFLKGKISNNEVPAALNEMDIFCALSHRESFGVSLVEAMAMEIPVIATDIDGFKEVLIEGKTGVLVSSKNLNQCALELKKLILNEDMRKEMGRKGREHVIKAYNWNDNVDKMETVYKQFNKRGYHI